MDHFPILPTVFFTNPLSLKDRLSNNTTDKCKFNEWHKHAEAKDRNSHHIVITFNRTFINQ